jgi:hypothetical protein
MCDDNITFGNTTKSQHNDSKNVYRWCKDAHVYDLTDRKTGLRNFTRATAEAGYSLCI